MRAYQFRWLPVWRTRVSLIVAHKNEVLLMPKAIFVFFFLMALVLLYLTIVVEQQFIAAGVCR